MDMKNRDIFTNTFEGGLDLDTDARLIANNKLRDSINIDLTKRGDSLVVVDLKGESVLFNFESVASREVYTLAATAVNFLISPTGMSREAILVFYVRSDFKFIVKALYLDDSSEEIILQEDLSEADYLQLKGSTIDFDVVGKFGYDVVYFVDNRRQPRKIDCITYATNNNVMTLTFNSEIDGDGYKQINLNLTSSSLPSDSHRAYVYAYKTGGPLIYTPSNPLTDKIKYLDVNYSGSQTIFFKIYPEDYGNYTFQIVYHKEGSVFYRNFIIGNPYQVTLSVGSLSNFIVGLRSTGDLSAPSQLPSWEFLYEGNSFVGYIDTPTVVAGTTKVYSTETESPLDYIPDGYYQRADVPNTFFRVLTGVITEQTINNANITWSVLPSIIEADVRAAALLIQEGNKERLSTITIHVPASIQVGGVSYNFVNTIGNNMNGRFKSSSSNNFTYLLEYPQDITPFSNYSPESVSLDPFIISVVKQRSGYNVTARAALSSIISQNLSVSIRVSATDVATGNFYPPVIFNLTILSGQESAEETILHIDGDDADVSYGPICVIDYSYLGPEAINVSNFC